MAPWLFLRDLCLWNCYLWVNGFPEPLVSLSGKRKGQGVVKTLALTNRVGLGRARGRKRNDASAFKNLGRHPRLKKTVWHRLFHTFEFRPENFLSVRGRTVAIGSMLLIDRLSRTLNDWARTTNKKQRRPTKWRGVIGGGDNATIRQSSR